jgi:hypothetical protein
MPGSRRFARRRRSRIDAACPNRRHARDCVTRFFAGTACGASPGAPPGDEVLAMLADGALVRR